MSVIITKHGNDHADILLANEIQKFPTVILPSNASVQQIAPKIESICE